MKPWTTIGVVSVKGRVMAVALGVFGCLVAAQVEAATPVQPAAPDEAFLLFLAEATEIEGQWVDPLTLAEVEDDLTSGTGEAYGTRTEDETGKADDTAMSDRTGTEDDTGKADDTAMSDGTGMEDGTGNTDLTGKADMTDKTGNSDEAGKAGMTGKAFDSGFTVSHPGRETGPQAGTEGGQGGSTNGGAGGGPAESGGGEGGR